MQKKLTPKEAQEIASKGIECYVRCTSNKVDQAKDDVRSICLNFDIKGVDSDGDVTNLGKGNNLNINNLTPGDYDQLCNMFGIKKMDEGTPIIAVLYHAEDYEQKQMWSKAWAREDKQIPEDQADVTQFSENSEDQAGTPTPAANGTITKKQSKYIHDMRQTSPREDSIVVSALKSAGVGTIEELSKEDASALIKKLKAAAKKE